MNRKITLWLVLLLALFTAISSCKKEQQRHSTPIKDVTAADSGQSISLAKGQGLRITLGNPGDGGFNFDAAQYDSGVLTLSSHVNNPPANSQLVGDFGTDAWVFTADQKGSSTITITASRPTHPATTITIFTGTIEVN